MCTWSRQLILQDVILALVINTSATLLTGTPLAWSTWYPFTCVAFMTNVIAQLLLPAGSWAHTLTSALGNASWRIYAQIFLENLVFVTIISLMEAFTQVGVAGMLDAWWPTYLWLVLIGYVTSVILYLAFKPRSTTYEKTRSTELK
ncbi:ABC transporter ATPase [Thermophilibacter immobilis]|uniref:ABC transporter ATPase n=1 Tax=Thermophilibacter immobilis TaxID=2779519 RepID=A0A7S7M7I8_9ACTN|nr:ABC transporter ATPase [Thermophilibacter immobilis]QOY60162.1 ABC transporter ATPase [Thermophilibacter immobilis]